MSASEKLQALRFEQDREGRWPTFPGDDVVLNALPQIVAVVEAAERAVRWESVTSSVGIEDGRVLWYALAALDEALS